MKLTKPAALSSLFRMKKWCGGVVIAGLAILLFMSYGLMGTEPPQKKQSASDFFRGQHQTTPAQQPLKSDKVAKSSYRPPLLNLDGLAELYAPRNFSKDELQALLVWAQMRLLLSRSDGLAGTPQGIKEASIAWQDLFFMIHRNKATAGNETNFINCPYSVASVDRISSGSGITLEIPCGLVEDSSITLVGIPDVKNGSFQIELLGSEFLKESNRPVILRYSVKLPGENITEEPFIVQNTWSDELGWGKEERCPSHRSASMPKVDELVLCNEQTVRSSVEKHANSTQEVSEVSTNASRGGGTSEVFAFVEGIPFTATLWVGLEGFHMTVNGRHETSFTYREKLEPWSVSRVRVAGGLEILSVLAKGLPVSEDHDLVSDVLNLKAPPTMRRSLVMLVGVFSTGNNFERRMALRRSWMQYEAVRSGNVAVRFFIGLHKNSQVNFELWKEAQAYGDIQLMPFVDYYSLITLKTIAISIMGTKILPAKYIMKTDDDAFVRIDEILTSLKGKPSNGLLYGLIAYDSSPHRDKESKWYVSSKEWPHNSYPPWAHGPGYIISRDIAKFIVKGHQDRYLKLFKLEDVAMGIWIEEFKNSGQEINYITDERFFNAGCDTNYVLAHYQSPRLVLCLWEKLQKEKRPICCE